MGIRKKRTMEFQIPRKCIRSKEDMVLWQASSTHAEICQFILDISDALADTKISDSYHKSEGALAVVSLLHELGGWLEDFPPLQQSMRFGNKAFAHWRAKLETEAVALINQMLPQELADQAAAAELAPYLLDSFGNGTRIDYGTGHEANFVAFLLCLNKLSVLQHQDLRAIGLFVFVEYVAVMRQIQSTYMMEPAGSHGVWGLDDYHFLPFLWGASQLVSQQEILPADVHDRQLLAERSGDFMYLDAIQFIYKVKTGGPFAEHSPILQSISQIPVHQGWPKVCEGFKKMYHAEVLGKLPVIQHFLFGSLLPAEWLLKKPEEAVLPAVHEPAVHQ